MEVRLMMSIKNKWKVDITQRLCTRDQQYNGQVNNCIKMRILIGKEQNVISVHKWMSTSQEAINWEDFLAEMGDSGIDELMVQDRQNGLEQLAKARSRNTYVRDMQQRMAGCWWSWMFERKELDNWYWCLISFGWRRLEKIRFKCKWNGCRVDAVREQWPQMGDLFQEYSN